MKSALEQPLPACTFTHELWPLASFRTPEMLSVRWFQIVFLLVLGRKHTQNSVANVNLSYLRRVAYSSRIEILLQSDATCYELKRVELQRSGNGLT